MRMEGLKDVLDGSICWWMRLQDVLGGSACCQMGFLCVSMETVK